MEKEYYLLDGKERTGPFTYRELVEQGLDTDTQLAVGLTGDWQYASELPEFIEYFQSVGIHFPTGDNLAGFGLRAGAFIIDMILLIIPLEFFFIKAGYIVIPSSIENITMPSLQNSLIMQSIFSVVFLLYNTLFEVSSWKGTIGKKICNLIVVDIDGNKLSFLRSLGRNLGALIASNLFYGVSFLSMLFSEHRQCWYDYLSKTYTVKTK
ncbi:RDD family protein [Mucilaginibacter auburnensis]|uniref:Putative RDD family membrane protein YckC n=1 Tax=Mucilaginibacter auburnensis TaxID=1457233 RepID=A0A2H9VND1_9SPHI|nr:RDD family protein [Mucilaginibacter auburnensis]PJJ79838.1 putative RDD family membrane protein YckC [Mucilaginibacter auburnensis]